MSDHTIDRINRILDRYKASSTGRLTISKQDVVFLQAAAIRLGEAEELREVVRRSIIDKGTDSVSAEVLRAMEDSGWSLLDDKALDYVRTRNRKARELVGRKVSVKLWGLDSRMRVNHGDQPSMMVNGFLSDQNEEGDREGTINLHVDVTELVADDRKDQQP